MRRRVVIAIVLVGWLCFACSHRPESRTFVARSVDSATFVQWTRTGTNLQGSYVQTTLDESTQPPQVSSDNAAFTGVISGSSITMNFGQGFIFAASVTGTLSGSTLTLSIPAADGSLLQVVFDNGTVQTYDAAVATLHQRASAIAAAQAKAAADQEREREQQQAAQTTLDQAAQSLLGAWGQMQDNLVAAGDAGRLGPDIQAAASDLRAAWSIFQSTAASEPAYTPSFSVPSEAEIQSALSCATTLEQWFAAHQNYEPGVQAPPSSCWAL